MKTKISRWKIIPFLLPAIMMIDGCISTTMIRSYPEHAKVYIDDEPVGYTPYSYADIKISFSTINIKLEKDGYEPFYESISRDERIDGCAVIGGVMFWFPLLWTFRYKSEHMYELEPLCNQAVKAPMLPEETLTSTQTDQLQQIGRLLDEGLMTPEEYDRERTKILDEE
jgi:hypothetical protein